MNIQWVKDKITLNNIFNRNQRFQRNDSSNSNSSTNSAPVTATSTPIATPVHHQRMGSTVGRNQSSVSTVTYNKHQHQPNLANSNRQNSFPAPRPKKYSQTSGDHPKLAVKSNSANSIITNHGTSSGSLRRRRFKQQYQARMNERRLSRQGSSGTSLSTSQEYSSTGTSITANPVVDRLLDYIRENYTNQMEPFPFEIGKKIRLTSFASFRMESGQLYGTSNFERIGDSKLIKSSDEITQIILASNILFSDILVEILFSAKIARFMMRDKNLRIFIEKCIFYVELAIDHTMSAKIKILRLVSMDGVEARTRGIPFPLNKSFDAYALKSIHTMAANSEQYTNQIVSTVNQFCDNLIENAIKSLSLMDLFW
ncbi:hypothetical protein BLA29_004219 [Euroglyphus maynei]|uniref:Uncharacterized protein n=1 Tax=Euroglyphus maynei TaxID=6958 RepID=A0A1Y3BQQ9_EURMA|nr:hypothetical protein BLA29_004219 [Euroglyphus maynei]